ncbi:MAG: RelA/SpoT family protein [Nannocystaceae bacterium]|nr:RelA/SpoT family protein [Nannocystaceae bacterium]
MTAPGAALERPASPPEPAIGEAAAGEPGFEVEIPDALRTDRRGPIGEVQLEDGSAKAAIVAEVQHHHPAADVGAIERAFELGVVAHRGQFRKSGEPYYVHPVRVATMLAQLGVDGAGVTAGLLHDVVEDTETTLYDLTEQFGREVATIVDGVTKLGKVPYLSRQEQQAESFRKMLLAMSQDIRVLLVKLIDRLDNMRTLEHMPRDKQERISRETMQIYAPLAGRLGIEVVHRELQELSFRYLEPAAWAATRADIARMLADRAPLVTSLANLRAVFDNSACSLDEPGGDDTQWPAELGEVEVRMGLRSAYRVYQVLQGEGRGLDQFSDVVSFRIVTRDRSTCYAALGQLHAYFQPVPGRFRDYVALPRPNHYRALHTSVIDRDGTRLEVQIRSRRMDAVAERGIVAEWELDRVGGAEARRLAWLSQLMDWQQEVSDPSEFIEAVKADLFADEVYVFTPGGDIHTFPKGSTPIDFAFAIHTDVGMHCTGARVNGQIVPLRYRLRQGDTVEILTNPSVEPREEWLKMCVSSRARAKIKQYLRQRERKRLRAVGRSLLEQELAGRSPALPLDDAGVLAEHAEAVGLPRETDDDGVLEAIGAGQIVAAAVAERLAPRTGATTPSEESGLFARMLRRMTTRAKPAPGETLGTHASAPIVITRERVEGRGGGRGMITLASCCSPVPGDALVGFFEGGRGIVAHVQGCPEALEQVGERRVHLNWETGLVLDCPVTLEVRTANTLGLLAEMSRAFSHHGVNIKQANCRAIGDGERAINTFYATVSRLEQLESLVATLKRIDGVGAVERVFSQGSGVYPR